MRLTPLEDQNQNRFTVKIVLIEFILGGIALYAYIEGWL